MLSPKILSIAFACLGLITAMVAAWYWFKASALPYPTGDSIIYAQEIDHRILLGISQGISRRSGKLNGRAAIWTGISAILSALSAVVGAL
jgi:hypothetical protein